MTRVIYKHAHASKLQSVHMIAYSNDQVDMGVFYGGVVCVLPLPGAAVSPVVAVAVAAAVLPLLLLLLILSQTACLYRHPATESGWLRTQEAFETLPRLICLWCAGLIVLF